MNRKVQIAKVTGLLVVLVSGVAAYLLGWLSKPQPWEKATGWDQIDPVSRPSVTSEAMPGGPEVFWLGHSSMLLRWGAVTLFLDPNTSETCTVSRRLLEPPASVTGLGTIDAALISHAHFDHMDMPTLRSLSDLREIVVPRGSQVFFDDPCWAGQSFRPLSLWEEHDVGAITITAVPAAHFGNRFHPLKSKYLAVGYVIQRGDLAVYYAGDTARRNDFARIREAYHPAIAILPIGAYSPRVPVGRYHLNPEEAVAVGLELGVSMVIPCHFGTFTLSLDRPRAALPRFAKAARKNDLPWMMPPFVRSVDQLSSGIQLAGRVTAHQPVE